MVVLVLFWFLFGLLIRECLTTESAPIMRLKNSSCSPFLSRLQPTIQKGLHDILPNEHFMDFIKKSSPPGSDILLLDVDKHTWAMSLNQAAALKRVGSGLIVHVMAYERDICQNFAKYDVPCFYDAAWLVALDKAYVKWTGRDIVDLKMLSVIMMGRMVASLITLCVGYNVFLSDSDVVFYRDPLDYVFADVDIMVTSTMIGPSHDWGAPYFVDKVPFYTLNNGVVYYRRNPTTQSFLTTLTGNSIAHLMKGPDTHLAFLQTIFNGYMQKHKLKLHPARGSKTSNNFTFKLNNTLSNKAGECYDCYFGDVVAPVKIASILTKRVKQMTIGVFPMERYVSLCSADNTTLTEKAVTASANALRLNDTTHWGWGQLENGTSRVLAIHANCIYFVKETNHTVAAAPRLSKKERWLRSINSWFI